MTRSDWFELAGIGLIIVGFGLAWQLTLGLCLVGVALVLYGMYAELTD